MDRSYSHVVVTTKAIPEITRTPDLLAPLLSPPYTSKYSQPTYVLLQNGLGVERDLYEALIPTYIQGKKPTAPLSMRMKLTNCC